MEGSTLIKVAWIGLGQMGLPTAKAVAAGGHHVRAFDVKPPTAEGARGLALAGSPREAAQDTDIVCLAVFSDDQVADVLTGPQGVIGLLKPGTIVAVFTTGSIESIQHIAAGVPEGIAVLDTCFSRMQSEMASGKMTLLVGGDAEAIERGKPVFDTFARAIFHVGASGAGRAIKLVNNILFAGHLQLASDALRLAQGLGLERSSTVASLIQCSGASEVLARFVDEDPADILESARRYMVKDVSGAIAAATKAGVELEALAAATATYLA